MTEDDNCFELGQQLTQNNKHIMRLHVTNCDDPQKKVISDQ